MAVDGSRLFFVLKKCVTVRRSRCFLQSVGLLGISFKLTWVVTSRRLSAVATLFGLSKLVISR